MDVRVTDLAIREGHLAARRVAARFDPTPADQKEVISQAGARIESALSRWGYNPAIIEEARAVMTDAYMIELARFTGDTNA